MKKILFVLMFLPLLSSAQNKWIDVYGETARGYYLWGKNTSNDNAKRISLFTKAIELDSTHSQSHFFRGIALKQEKELEKAIIDFLKVIEIGEYATPNAHNQLSIIYEMKNDLAQACLYANEAVNLGIEDDEGEIEAWLKKNCN